MNARFALLPAIFLLGFFIMLPLGLALDFSVQNVSSSTFNISTTNQITINVTNLDNSTNITQVNLALGSFTFIQNSNSTSSFALFGNSGTALNWSNISPGLISNGSSHTFTFNVSAPSEDGSYNITVNVTYSSGAYNITNITYTVFANFSLTFSNLSAMQMSSNAIQNLNYTIGITNNGASGSEIYNLSVVNCSNANQAGVGTLNVSSITLAYGGTVYVVLSVSNSTAGLYSSCIMANHWNGASMNTSWNFTSLQDGKSFNSSFYPDIAVPAIYWSVTGGSQHPYSGSNISVYNLTVNNTGHFNLSGNPVIYLLWDGALIDNQTIQNTSLANGTSFNVSFSNITGITSGPHNLTVWADVLGSVSEYSEANNNYTTQLYVGYNITVSVMNASGGVQSYTAKNITLNVTVKYGNGDPVTNLGRENFTIYDSQSGEMISLSNHALNTTFSSAMNASGVYWFNISSHAPGNNTDTLPGVHNLTVEITNNESGRVYSGNNTGYPYYYLLVPRLVISFVCASSSCSFGETGSKVVYMNVSNTGTDAIYNVTITYFGDSPLSLSALGSSCTPKTNGNNMVGVGDFIYCSTTATSSDITEIAYPNIEATATGQHNNTGGFVTYYRIGTQGLTVNVVSGGGTTTDDGGGGGGNTTRTCTSDSGCGANESCVSRRCVAISCADGEIMDHVCFKFSYKINITAFEPAFRAVSGEGVSTKVTVKNTGTKTFTAKLEVSLSSVSASVSPASFSLGTGESYQFTVNFTVPNSTTVGNFSGTFKAFVSTSTGFSESKAFVFTVLPREETKQAINASYSELSSMLQNLSGQLTRMRASGMYNQTILSSIESLVNAAISSLSTMKSSIDSGDYVSAQSLISQINSSLSSAEINIRSAAVEQGPGLGLGGLEQAGIWFWVAVGVIIIFVVGFFVYMFLPSRGSGAYRPPERPLQKQGSGSKIKGIFRKKEQPAAKPAEAGQHPEEEKFEAFHYSEGYRKEKPYNYEPPAQGGGIKGVFKKLRKKKKEKSPQMHIDQFANSTSDAAT
jgi:hypothetical protein